MDYNWLQKLKASASKSTPVVHRHASEVSPKFYQSALRDEYLLAARLTSLEKRRTKAVMFYDEQLSRLQMELNTYIKPRSLDLDRLTIPKEKIQDKLAYRTVHIPTWIPTLESTRQVTLKQADVSLKVYSVVRKNSCYPHMDLPAPETF